MRCRGLIAASILGTLVSAGPASADIVKAPTGPSSQIKPNKTTLKALEKGGVTWRATGKGKKSGSTLSLPYSLARWDFQAHDGDVAHFQKSTGFRLRRAGGHSISMVHPRVVVDGSNGYITALIAGVRVKTFTFKLASGTITDTASQQTIKGLKLKLTKASADYLNRGLKRKVLRRYSQFGTLNLRLLKPSSGSGPIALKSAPGQGTNPGGTLRIGPGLTGAVPAGGTLLPLSPSLAVDTNGDGQAEANVIGLPLKGATFDATSRTGTISLNGGLVVRIAGQDVAVLDDPEIVVGTTPQASGLYALVQGVRVKVGDIDPSKLNVNVHNGTVTISDLDVLVAPGVTLPGVGLLAPGTQLLSLDLSLPQS
ncbi:MAG TPA: hypothetical protein VNT22_08525 [Baekduia sp.]|nr:hypothetical protein [Baekduia sp.]